MRFTVTFKTPDAVDRAFGDLTEEALGLEGDPEDVERDLSDRKDDLRTFLERWVRNGEVVYLEFDTESKTATVLPARRL